jgi:uncharacterized protein YjbJ (UPF0337 family)
MHYYQDSRRFQMYQINNKGNWIALKEKIKKVYTNITEDDLKLENGDEGELLIRLQKKLGKTKKEVIALISDL